MNKQNIMEKLQLYADKIKSEFAVKMVILQQSFDGEESKPNAIIDVAVVVDLLKADDDYLEVKQRLAQLAHQVDPRIDIDLIEEERVDPTGFFASIRKTGKIVFEGHS